MRQEIFNEIEMINISKYIILHKIILSKKEKYQTFILQFITFRRRVKVYKVKILY